MVADTRSCLCSHALTVHTHYRRGTDCSSCGCQRFNSAASLAGRIKRMLKTHPIAGQSPIATPPIGPARVQPLPPLGEQPSTLVKPRSGE